MTADTRTTEGGHVAHGRQGAQGVQVARGAAGTQGLREARGGIRIWPVLGLAEIEPGADLAAAILDAVTAQGAALADGDIVVITQKVVSKADGCLVNLADVEPSPLATEWANRWAKDARVVELVLRHSRRIVRMDRGVIISETFHGLVCANAGVDCSNVGGDRATLLPPDPDGSAARVRAALEAGSGARLGVIISDTFGRAWREGQTNVAIGCSGVEALRHFEGQTDPTGYELRVTMLATADELAGAAELVMGKVDGVPVAVVSGLERALAPGRAAELVRPPANDLLR
jgi:coenzyme F420-0:L-glutamate ligase/coenzyme F420-1:gamma-L-glutamate ligase